MAPGFSLSKGSLGPTVQWGGALVDNPGGGHARMGQWQAPCGHRDRPLYLREWEAFHPERAGIEGG